MKELVVYGAWYFGRVVAEIARSCDYHIGGFVDPNPPEGIEVLQGIPPRSDVFVAIGDNGLREEVAQGLVQRGHRLVALVHPSAVVSPSAALGPGCLVAELAVVRAGASLGMGVVLQAGSVVSHDSSVAPFASFGPNAACASKCRIGARVAVGVGASLRPGTRIADDCTVAAGAAVFRDSEPGQTLVGNPARATRSAVAAGKQSDWSANRVW